MLALMKENAPEQRRTLTPEELRECAQLKSIFESKKKDLGITQQTIADELGITQATMSQYLTGRRSLNLKVAKTSAQVLRVDIGDFSQRLKKQALDIAFVAYKDQKNNDLSLIGVETPHKVMVHSFAQIITNNRGHGRMIDYYGEISPSIIFMSVDTDMMHGMSGLPAPKGATLVIDEGEAPAIGDTAVFNLAGSAAIGEFSYIGDKPHVRPTNPQYPMMDVSGASLVGVVLHVMIAGKKRS